jgi:broad specificity phosphatase PhoE
MRFMRSSGIKVIAAVLAASAVLTTAGGPPPPPSIILTFVRHAESQGNASGMVDTSVPGPALTPHGQEQAEKAADRLRDNHFDGIYASTMVRTQQTAAPLAADLDEQVEVLPGLREIEAGSYEGRPESDAATGYFQAPASWLAGDRNARIPGSIDGIEFNDRFSGAVQQIYDSGEHNPVAFAHGGSIMVWTMMNVRNPDQSLMSRHPLANTATVVLRGNPIAGWTLIDWDGIPTGG